MDKVSENVGKTILLHDQTILQDNSAARPDNPATRPDNPAPARPDNPETQSCTRCRCMQDQTIRKHNPAARPDNPETQSCTRCRCMQDQTIRKHNPATRPRQFRRQFRKTILLHDPDNRTTRQSGNTILHPMPLYARQSCKTILHLHDQTILEHNPAPLKHNPAARPDNPETQSCYTTRTIPQDNPLPDEPLLLHDQTILLHDPDNPETQSCTCKIRQPARHLFRKIKVYSSIYGLFSDSWLDFHRLIGCLYSLHYWKGCKWLRIGCSFIWLNINSIMVYNFIKKYDLRTL
jgi:hypothetical protein